MASEQTIMRPNLPPAAVRDAAVLRDSGSFYNARFVSDSQMIASARTALHLSGDPDQMWVPIDTTNIRFLLSTPKSLSLKHSHEDDDDQDLVERKKARINIAKESAKQYSETRTAGAKVGKLLLRTNKPLRNADDVHMDVWRIVLKYTPPKFLLDAKTINSNFRTVLSESSTWRDSRLHHYSDSMPDPPGNMSEQRYIQLLEGKGCQNMSCSRANTGKIYWAFCIRLCTKCLPQMTMREEEIETYRFKEAAKQGLLKLLPAALVDSGKYSRSRQLNAQGTDWEHMTAGPMFLKSDLDAIEAEHDDLSRHGATAEAILDWKKDKREATQTLMTQIAKVESWARERDVSTPHHRGDRVTFFRERALQMVQPMSEVVLSKMLAYKMALDANAPPTEKSWNLLKAKILPYRAEAVRLVRYTVEIHSHQQPGTTSAAFEQFMYLRARWSGRHQSPKSFRYEQEFVLHLARDQLVVCKAQGVADADLLLCILRAVFKAYNGLHASSRPTCPNENGLQEIHALTLDDARMVLQEVVEPEVRLWNDSRREADALEKFKCVGCPRTDCTTKYTFDKLFEHILSKHAIFVGEGHEFWRLFKPFPKYCVPEHFPWYTVEWFRNLPILAAHHQMARGDRWDPNASLDYVEAQRPGRLSAFAGRQPGAHADIAADDFARNITFAAKQLFPTALSKECQTRIALQFALDKYAMVHGTSKPGLDDFTNEMKRIQNVNLKFDFRYRCGVCSRQVNVPRTTKFIKSPVQFHELEDHFQKKHSQLDWTVDLMALPSSTELQDQIVACDAELERHKGEIQAREEARKGTAKKRANAKASVVLSTPRGMDVFDTLYLKS